MKTERFLPYFPAGAGSGFYVYRWTDSSKKDSEKVLHCASYAMASDEAYRLNGEFMRNGLPF
ncbi:MAG: hypothetical protein LBN27_03560 [Prevotellaceae bacterium]|jgi:hypothetical protein|nr:hypothetical protein [Prevotellaceae bacterium]